MCAHTPTQAYTHTSLCLLRGNHSLGLSPPTPLKYLLHHPSLPPAFLPQGQRRSFPAPRAQLSLPPILQMASGLLPSDWLFPTHLILIRTFSAQNRSSTFPRPSSFPPHREMRERIVDVHVLVSSPTIHPANRSVLSPRLPYPQRTLANALAKTVCDLQAPNPLHFMVYST